MAEQSLTAAERLQHILSECQQKDARICASRCQDALLGVAALDELLQPQGRRALPRRELPGQYRDER